MICIKSELNIFLGEISMQNKIKYMNSVKFCLESMLYIAQGDSKYDLHKDLVYYYNTIVVPDNIISRNEFVQICKEVGMK